MSDGMTTYDETEPAGTIVTVASILFVFHLQNESLATPVRFLWYSEEYRLNYDVTKT